MAYICFFSKEDAKLRIAPPASLFLVLIPRFDSTARQQALLLDKHVVRSSLAKFITYLDIYLIFEDGIDPKCYASTEAYHPLLQL
jgi:hypothetical protein